MRHPGGRRLARRRDWLVTGALVVAIGLVLMPRTGPRTALRGDTWTRLIEMGDGLATAREDRAGTPHGLTARKAYLLAFHAAQDASDPEHVLAVADRLDAIGELDLAAYIRGAASTLLEELGLTR